VGNVVHRLQAKAGARLTEPEFRPGSRTDGLAPISVAARSLAAQPSHWLSLSAVALSAVLADQLTKHVVASQLPLDGEVHVVGPFTIHHVQNSGIAFGLFASATAAVIVLTTVAVAWMIAYFARSGARHPLLPVAVGLLIGGSVSNLADRVRLGHVTDFLDLRYWPAFNLADSFIVVGVAVLLGALVSADRAPRRSRVREATTRP
jgi:signal peptidase II